jgi:SAM-dependent MidA family methyltransferase
MELGAGSGALAVDLLQALADREALPARYLILERSADLRERQRKRIAAVVPRGCRACRVAGAAAPNSPSTAPSSAMKWSTRWPARASWSTRRWTARNRTSMCGTAVSHHRIAPRPARRMRAFAHLQTELEQPLPPGYTSELIPELTAWFAAVSAPLRRGLVLLADYGYGRPSTIARTHHRHADLPLPPPRP